MHLTVYPTGILDEEKEVKDVERCKKELISQELADCLTPEELTLKYA